MPVLLAAAVAVSTGTATPKPAPAPKPARVLGAVIHAEAARWEPLALRSGDPAGPPRNEATLKSAKVQGRLKGEASKAEGSARSWRGPKGSRWLAITLHPWSLERRRTHFEVRFRIFEGYVEEARVAAVTVIDRRAPEGRFDSQELRARGVEYREESPGSGTIVVSELDPRPGAVSRNSGRLENAEFPGAGLGNVALSWSVKGVQGED